MRRFGSRRPEEPRRGQKREEILNARPRFWIAIRLNSPNLYQKTETYLWAHEFLAGPPTHDANWQENEQLIYDLFDRGPTLFGTHGTVASL